MVARERNLPTELTILSERWNTVARLGDSGLVARAATLANLARANPLLAFQQEVDVCRELASRAGPVQVPVGDVTEVDGFPISLWQHVDGVMGEATGQAMVETLARIHSLGSDITLNQPWFATVATSIPDDIRRLTDRSLIDKLSASSLIEHFDRNLNSVEMANLPGGLIHGDAQRKNAMAVDGSAIWIDFEDCCIGPYAWDLACLTMNSNYPVESVLDTYAEASGTDRIPSDVMPFLWALRDLEAMTWMLLIQDDREPEFQKNAQELLRDIVSRASAG